ncbi:nucleotidyltransferase family protein [Viridibacillus sp. FSL R5-0477]|uniref:Mannose-1-phosphate guanylyltransferase n=1 Tax=Viridibacillus arenosi FSL R5-213 TaxID=1227360 RepID=W4F4T0_9BACL|nr:nucleotidyltransferase family protein [Viridibacillus arenosi]ETT87863.1 mannose-1-phosphate guanylyltransferase [Viridibacillus arenosi FSL R5-213]OMC89875.1 alcohol dehydrogenase [Viridibacillus arenosi]
MKNWRSILVNENTTLLETMKIIDDSSMQFAAVVDETLNLLGTVTDGDIRRGILRGEGLDVPIKQVMNSSPVSACINNTYSDCLNLLKKHKLKQLPIIDMDNRIIDIIFADEDPATKDNGNTVILMAGGLGTRLRPLTENIPKPMLNVGNKPILETIIEGFKQYGFTNFILSVNYKKEVIQDYFQDGSAFGVSISYIEEDKRMGTAGALSLLKEKPSSPIFVMNGDLLTQVNFEQLLQFHEETEAAATMCVREYEYQIPYGVIETEGQQLVSIKEKPMHRSFVNAGIYVLSPEVFDYIPQDEFYDMPDLFKKLMDEQNNVSAFPVREYWLDIGRMADFEQANSDYKEEVK